MSNHCDECREKGKVLVYCGRCDEVICTVCRQFHHEYLHVPAPA